MAKRKTKRRRASKSGAGKFCITTTKKRSKSSRGRGGLSFSTVCYKTSQAQTDALLRRMTTGGPSNVNVYSVMAYKKKRR